MGRNEAKGDIVLGNDEDDNYDNEEDRKEVDKEEDEKEVK